MHLDEHIEADLPSAEHILQKLGGREDARDQENGVCAEHARLEDLVLVDDEILAQERQIDERAHASQVLVRTEEMRIGMNRQHRSAVLRVDAREFIHRMRAAQPSFGRRLQLALGNEIPVARLKALRHIKAAAALPRPRLELGNRQPPLRLRHQVTLLFHDFR